MLVCSQAKPHACSAEEICANAKYYTDGQANWRHHSIWQVQEAKRRILIYGIIEASVSKKSVLKELQSQSSSKSEEECFNEQLEKFIQDA